MLRRLSRKYGSDFMLNRNVRTAWSVRCLGNVEHTNQTKEIVKLIHKVKSSDEKCNALIPSSQFMVFHKSSVLIEQSPQSMKQTNLCKVRWMNYESLNELAGGNSTPDELTKVFLGINNSDGSTDAKPAFAVQMHPNVERETLDRFVQTSAHFMKVDYTIFTSRVADIRLIQKANSMFRWKRSNKFCSSCGSTMTMAFAGYKHSCSACGHSIYCQGSPAINVLLVDGKKDLILLVRIPAFPKHFFSVVAGYIDIGEDAEEAVEREVLEELGLRLVNLKYIGSSSWMMRPDPLMFGYIAEVSSGQPLDVNPEEIVETLWLGRGDVADYFKNRSSPTNAKQIFHIPPEGTLAYTLIREWMNES